MTSRSLLLLASLLGSGLMGGFFFAWMVSVIPGTSMVDDRAYIETMQNINREIINPTFVITFMMTPLILAGAAYIHVRAGMQQRGLLLALAAATYVVGVVGVTVGGNVPLNDALELFDLDQAPLDDVTERRTSYEGPWNRWHNLRTAAAVATLGFAALAATITETID